MSEKLCNFADDLNEKDMKKSILSICFRIFLLLFATGFTHATFAQRNTSASYDGKKLIGKKWYFSEIVDGVRETRTMVFDKDSVKEVVVRGNKTFILHEAYYLDKYPSIEFFPGMVGHNTQGKYLYRSDGHDSYGVIIRKLTDNEFIYSFYKNSPLIKYTAIKDK